MKKRISGLLALLFFTALLPGRGLFDGGSPGVLILAADGFGYNYFDLKEGLERRGIEVATVAPGKVIRSCSNREPRPVEADYVIGEFPPGDFKKWDALIIPSGGHHELLGRMELTRKFISDAWDKHLIIGGICTGEAVLARCAGLLDGVTVARNGFFYKELSEAGALMSYDRVHFDRGILTGSNGGGRNSGGYELAPTEPFIERLVLALSES
ncbi:DJ-1/PfpI family protein [Spirochaeta isovalerica]|uniref:Putative intracellular protease/amidase n=1 Tax=Spirochaeta isovalerica TaxID=150 RepID=A0A841R9X3_9SPIO|nr:DJ-1/PfpI family protein [Spirochaeta isovalerica]MBB6479729.1 putative intracellular protease/amidase [Spirochaeta isovalerica]